MAIALVMLHFLLDISQHKISTISA